MTVDMTCPYCSFSKKIPEDKIPAGARWATCPRCRRRFEIPFSVKNADFVIEEDPSGPGRPTAHERGGETPPRGPSPWEERSGIGLWQAIYLTVKAVLFSPDRFFGSLNRTAGIGDPFAFGLLTGAVGGMFSSFWQFLMLSGGLLSVGHVFAGRFTFGMILLVLIVLIPTGIMIALFVTSAVWHLFLLMLRGADHGYEATFRVVAYSQAVQLWGIIPVVGGWISFVWQIIVQIIGLKEIHETTYVKVIFAFLIPVAAIVFLVFATIIVLALFLGHLPFTQLWS